MDAKTRIKARLPSRQVTEAEDAAVAAASGGSTNAAMHLPAIAHECGIALDLFDVAEIFKKTPYVADLKPAGRYVAKDMFEVGGIPLLMKTLLDNGHLHGDCFTVTGRTIAENLKSVNDNPHLEGEVIDTVVGTLNVKLTGAERAERKTKWLPRETNPTSDALWKYAQQVGPAVDGAVTHPGGAHEKQCYADI
jgi:dihydroxyacid dehydratase/phosphogluconate dehydratase